MLTTEDLQAIKAIMNEQTKPINERLDRIESNISEIKQDIEQLKEDTEITRGATNEILEWLDTFHRDGKEAFPVDRKTPIAFEG